MKMLLLFFNYCTLCVTANEGLKQWLILASIQKLHWVPGPVQVCYRQVFVHCGLLECVSQAIVSVICWSMYQYGPVELAATVTWHTGKNLCFFLSEQLIAIYSCLFFYMIYFFQQYKIQILLSKHMFYNRPLGSPFRKSKLIEFVWDLDIVIVRMFKLHSQEINNVTSS